MNFFRLRRRKDIQDVKKMAKETKIEAISFLKGLTRNRITFTNIDGCVLIK